MAKILFIDQFGKTTGSDTIALAELVNGFHKHDVTVYLSDNTNLLREDYVTPIVYGFHNVYSGNFIKKTIKYLKSLKELKKHIFNNNYDVVHFQWFSLPWIERFFIKKIKKKAKVIITVHDVIPFDKRIGEMSALKSIYKHADCLLLHTEKAAKDFKNVYKIDTPIQVITQGFCNKNDYTIVNKKEAREHLDVSQDSKVFLFYGTIRPSKGFETLIEAIKKAHNSDDKVFLLGAGAFHNVDEELFLSKANEIDILQIGRFDFGFVPREEEQFYFSAADVLCLPYKEVTQSGVAQLGLMYELPIIATDVGSMDEVVINGVNGLLINKDNPDELAKAIVALCDSKKRLEFAKQSKILGETTFSLNKKAEKVFEAYDKVLNHNK